MNLFLLLASLCLLVVDGSASPFNLTRLERYFATFTDKMRLEARELTREMFYFGYESYMAHAWPEDELDPIHCTGRGPDRDDPSNININDVLGDFQLTLIDTLDSLAVFGDEDEFKRAVSRVMHTVSFEKDSTVQVFETTIRVIGGLLSAHLIATDESGVFGDKYRPSDYNGELLSLAHEMAARLMPAFEGTETGLPYPRVNLIRGVVPGTINETCVSGAGTLLLEMGVLSRLTGDDTFELAARRINDKLFSLRHHKTGLFGNVVDIMTGEWRGHLSGVGAGLDSFYEYLLKAYILFGERRDLEMFNEAYEKHLHHARRGRTRCVGARGEHPLFVNVDARDGSTANTWIDALQAAWPGVQLLAGDVDEAVCQHAVYYAVWSRFGALPERYNWHSRDTDVSFYPLRPEFAESTYLLYRATRNPFYLHVGRHILHSLNNKTRVECGFATIHDVNDGSLEDRMESFFLSETLKYLYLLFDESNVVNVHEERLLFTTEGHIFPIDERWRRKRGEGVERERDGSTWKTGGGGEDQLGGGDSLTLSSAYRRSGNDSCERPPARERPPLDEHQLVHLFKTVGMDLTAS